MSDLVAEARAAFRNSPGYELGIQSGSAIDLVRRLADEVERLTDSLPETDYHEGFEEGYKAAIKVFEERFFGGPTKDMVLGWWEAEKSQI